MKSVTICCLRDYLLYQDFDFRTRYTYQISILNIYPIVKRAVARSSTYTLDTASRAPLLFCCCCNQNELMSTSRIVSTSTRDHRPLTTTSIDRRQQQQQLMLMPTIMTRSYLHFGEQNLTTIKLINL